MLTYFKLGVCGAACFALVTFGLLCLSARKATEATGFLVEDSRQAILDTLNRIDAAVIIANSTLVNTSELLGRVNDAAEKQSNYWEQMTLTTGEALDNLRQSGEAFTLLLHNTDTSLNQELLPNLTQSARNLDQTSTKSFDELNKLLGTGTHLVEDFRRDSTLLMTEMESILKHTDQTVTETRDMMADIRISAPRIMEDIESISNRSDRWHPWVMLASLAGTVVGIFGFIF